MKSLFEATAYQDVISRLELLDENSQPLWGEMDVAQMLCHCKNPLSVALGKKSLKKPNFFMKLIYMSFKSAMYNDTPWKKNLATPKEYKVESEKNFNSEKNALLDLLAEFFDQRTKTEWESHPAFGNFTHDQWGMLQYKHLDHHLRQFGV